MIDTAPPLRWKRIAQWDLSPQHQVLFVADGRDAQYKIARAGTADKPSWSLYKCQDWGSGSMEECLCVSNRLRDLKSYAQSAERRARLSA